MFLSGNYLIFAFVKNFWKNIILLIAPLGLFLILGNSELKNQPAVEVFYFYGDTLTQVDDSGTPVDYQSISSRKNAQSVPTQEYSGSGFTGIHERIIVISRDIVLCTFPNPSFNSSDRRKLIFQFIYPFHFFF